MKKIFKIEILLFFLITFLWGGVLVYSVAAQTKEEQFKQELEQANEAVNFLQKQYDVVQKKNKELEKLVADLNNLLILKEAELKSYAENAKRVQQVPNKGQKVDLNLNAGVKTVRSLRQASENLPIGTPPPAPVESTILTLYISVDGTGLYVGPGGNYPLLMKLQKGAMLQVEDRQGDWFKVLTIGGMRGFVYKAYLTKTATNKVPVPTAGQIE
ncbi:MAG: SH3 domain-containing protein [Deltaproteobacteria bacterium]|jgi:uncharacterized protein YgiM (DUF1202 family)|nr:SH3 domain-containing protein [Deltaproteobacteria bacterium]